MKHVHLPYAGFRLHDVSSILARKEQDPYLTKLLKKKKAHSKKHTDHNIIPYYYFVGSLFLHAFIISLFESLAKNCVCTIGHVSLRYHK